MIKIYSLFIFFLLSQNSQAQKVIKMQSEGGVSIIPCKVNGLNLKFVFDTGASNVSISLTEALFMLKNDYLSSDDIIGKEKYKDANGAISEGVKINLKEIEIEGIKIYNVEASIVKNQKAPLLLGQSAISKLGQIQIDLRNNTLTISNSTNNQRKFVDNRHYLGEDLDGGTIFYLDMSKNHGLIVYQEKIRVTSNRLSTGTYFEAVNAIRNLGFGWRLPSSEELEILYMNKSVIQSEQIYRKNENGQLVPLKSKQEQGSFWSSSQCSGNSAWIIDFIDGEKSCHDKEYFFGFRPIKSF